MRCDKFCLNIKIEKKIKCIKLLVIRSSHITFLSSQKSKVFTGLTFDENMHIYSVYSGNMTVYYGNMTVSKIQY